MPTSEEQEAIKTSGRNSPRTLVEGESRNGRDYFFDSRYLVHTLLYKVGMGERLKKYIIFLLWYACATPTQHIEIADLWETEEIFDCLESGTCSSDFDDPDCNEWGGEGPGIETAESLGEWCPVHDRVMVDTTETEATVKVSKK